MNRLVLLLFFGVFTLPAFSQAQEVKVYKFYRDRSFKLAKNHFVNGADTVKVSNTLTTSDSPNRGIYQGELLHSFKRNKITKKTELQTESGEVLAVCEGIGKKFYNLQDASGNRLVMKKTKKDQWEYWAGDKRILSGKFKKGELGLRVELTVEDPTHTNVDLAKMMSFAYATDLVKRRAAAPIIIGLTVGVVVIKAVFTEDKTPMPQ